MTTKTEENWKEKTKFEFMFPKNFSQVVNPQQFLQQSGFYNGTTTFQFLFQPLLRGEELYTQMVFFVKTILTDRYFERREF